MAIVWSGTDLLNPLEAVPLAIVAAAVVSIVILARRRKRRVIHRVAGVYLICFALALVLAFASRDEFGFSFIPTILLAAPWTFLIPPSIQNILPPSFHGSHFGIFPLAALLNCLTLFLIGRVSYPKHATTLSGDPRRRGVSPKP